MNETQVNALLAALEAQRNNALNAVAQSEATNAVLRARIAELEKAAEAKPEAVAA